MLLNILQNPYNSQLCSYDHPQEILLSYVCVSLQCKDQNRLCCLKCLIEHHRSHINHCIHVNSANQFLMNSIMILEDSFDIECDKNDNFQLFEKFITTKLRKLKRAIIKINNIKSLLQYIDEIIVAYNIHNLMKQFISECDQIIEKQLFFSKLDEIFTQNQKLYLDELQYNAKILKQQFYYEECIKCCENYLNLQVEQEMQLLKGQCQHMVNQLDEAEKTLTEVQNNYSQNKKSLNQMILLIESSQEKIFNNLQIDFSIIDQNIITLLIGKQLIIQKKYQLALQIFDENIDEDYLSYFSITYKGLCSFYLGQQVQAQECCEKALIIYPKYYAAIYLKYLLLMQEEQDDEAMKIIQSRFDSKNQSAITSNLFKLFQNEKNYPQLSNSIEQQFNYFFKISANTMVQDIQIKQNNDLENLFKKGLKLLNNLYYDEAIEIFQQGISLDEKNETFWKYKILTQFLQQQISEVDVSLQIYLSMNPNSREIINLRNQFKFTKYLILTLEPNLEINQINMQAQDPQELYEEGYKCLQGKYYSKALEIFSFLCEKDPFFEEAQLKKSYIMIILKRFEDADIVLEKLSQSEKCYLQALQMKGIALYEKGQFNQALSTFKQVESIDPNFIFVRFYQGHCYYKMKKYHQAKDIYLNLLDKTDCHLQIQSYSIRYIKTILVLKQEIEYKAYFKIERILKEQQCSELLMLYIFISSVAKEFNQAIEFGLSLFKNFINCQIFLIKLAELYLKLQHYDLAKAFCAQVISLNPIYYPALALSIKIMKAQNLNADQYIQLALLMDPNILNEEYIHELQLAELEEYEPKMFIPELHSLQENLFHQLNCFF